MARHGANYASPCRLDRLPAIEMARLGTPYCGVLREQNSAKIKMFINYKHKTYALA